MLVFFSIFVPFLISIVLYQLDSFDPVHFPADSLISSASSIPSLINDRFLTGAEFIGVGRLNSPEDIAYHKDSNLIYTGCADGWVKRVKGLLNISDDGKKTELLTDEAEGVGFKLTDAVVVADNGVLYFTDATYKYNIHQFIFDFLEGKPHGRLIRFDPTTRVTRVLVKDLYFANGVSLSPDQTHLVFCETVMRRCSKYYINEYRVEVFIQGLPGYPDNIRYDGDGHYWIALISEVTTPWKLSMKYTFLRKIIAIAAKYSVELLFIKNAGVMQVDLEGNPIALYHDHPFSHITSGVKIGNHLYSGNLLHSYITRLDLLKYPAQKKL